MNQEQINRINILARKSKTEGLSEEEKKEQAFLRQMYIEAIRKNFRAQMDQIDVIEPDGSIRNLGQSHNQSNEK